MRAVWYMSKARAVAPDKRQREICRGMCTQQRAISHGSGGTPAAQYGVGTRSRQARAASARRANGGAGRLPRHCRLMAPAPMSLSTCHQQRHHAYASRCRREIWGMVVCYYGGTGARMELRQESMATYKNGQAAAGTTAVIAPTYRYCCHDRANRRNTREWPPALSVARSNRSLQRSERYACQRIGVEWPCGGVRRRSARRQSRTLFVVLLYAGARIGRR